MAWRLIVSLAATFICLGVGSGTGAAAQDLPGRTTVSITGNDIIMTTADGAEGVIDDATGVALNRVVFANDRSGLVAATYQGTNTLIIVKGRAAPIDVRTVSLRRNQTLLGGGGTLRLRGASTGAIVDFTAPGETPTLHNWDNRPSPLIKVVSNNHVVGLDLEIDQALRRGEGGYVGIYGSGRQLNINTFYYGIGGGTNYNITINDVNIRNTGAVWDGTSTRSSDGILIREGSHISIYDVTVTGVLGDGINFITVDGAQVWDVAIDNASLAGIRVNNGSNDISITDFSITDAGKTGLGLFSGSNFTAANGEVDGTGGQFFGVGGRSINLGKVTSASIDGVTVDGSAVSGFLAIQSTDIALSGSSFVNGSDIRFLNSSGSIVGTIVTGVDERGHAVSLEVGNRRTVTVDVTGITLGDSTTPIGLRMVGENGTINVSGSGNISTAVTACTNTMEGAGEVIGTVEINAASHRATCP